MKNRKPHSILSKKAAIIAAVIIFALSVVVPIAVRAVEGAAGHAAIWLTLSDGAENGIAVTQKESFDVEVHINAGGAYFAGAEFCVTWDGETVALTGAQTEVADTLAEFRSGNRYLPFSNYSAATYGGEGELQIAVTYAGTSSYSAAIDSDDQVIVTLSFEVLENAGYGETEIEISQAYYLDARETGSVSDPNYYESDAINVGNAATVTVATNLYIVPGGIYNGGGGVFNALDSAKVLAVYIAPESEPVTVSYKGSSEAVYYSAKYPSADQIGKFLASQGYTGNAAVGAYVFEVPVSDYIFDYAGTALTAAQITLLRAKISENITVSAAETSDNVSVKYNGDINGSGGTLTNDRNIIRAIYIGNSLDYPLIQKLEADLNGDGYISSDDYAVWNTVVSENDAGN